MDWEDIDRRTLLRMSGLAATAGLAGCSNQQSTDESPTATGTDPPTGTSTPTETAEPTKSGAPPGADQLGGPDDLQAAASVEATALSADEGAGQNVFTPAVVWIEQGAAHSYATSSQSYTACGMAISASTSASFRSKRPVFGSASVTTLSELTAAPKVSPVVASMPDGTSRETTVAPSRSAAERAWLPAHGRSSRVRTR